MDNETILRRRKELKDKLRNGELEDETIEIHVEDTYNPTIELFSGVGMEEYNINIGDIFGDLLPKN